MNVAWFHLKKCICLFIHHQANFDALIHRGFCIIPKIADGNLCKLFDDIMSPFSKSFSS